MDRKKSMLQLIEQLIKDDQDRTAIALYDGKKITDISCRRFAHDVLCAANFFVKNQFSNRHIALIAPNSYEWLLTFLAILLSGNVAVPLNPGFPESTLLRQCETADVSLICGTEITGSAHGPACIRFDKIREKEELSLAEIACSDPDDTMVLLFTSGTTGKSKAAEISDENLMSCLRSADGVFSSPDIDKIITVLPLYHIAGLRGVLTMLYRYKTLCLGRGPMYLFQDMYVFSPSYAHLVPIMAESIAKILKHTPREEDRKKFLGTNLKRICIGGASVNLDVCRYLMQEGIAIDCGYAMTETTGVGTWGSWDDRHFNTIGKLSDELLCRIEDGELLFKGSSIMKGYYKDPEATASVIEDGWLHSGDLGFCDEEGFYYITGRKKNLIVMPNGEKLNPEEIEMHLTSCDAISECMVYFNKNALCADIYTLDREKAAAFIEKYNDKMPLSFHIHTVHFLEKPLLKTGSGKILRNEAVQ